MSDQGKEYAAFIAAELKVEHERRGTVNSRSAAALTAVTGLVTVIVAVFTLVFGREFTLAGSAKVMLVIALFAMLCTAGLSLFAGLAKTYDTASTDTMRAMVDSHWTDSEVSARNITAYCNIRTLETLRAGTNFKYRILLIAGLFQMAAVFALILCVAFGLGVAAPEDIPSGVTTGALRVVTVLLLIL
ncbi:hypothetical protein [Nocardia sp. NPDC052566]|uniref:hypothetical protein n=1 Tax=Nocardia sp. NPDC052566 TaxID=3364330 RepID=UPI0037CAF9BF